MKSKKYYLALIMLLALSNYCFSQESQIGRKVADLAFEKVLNDRDTTYKISDFMGEIVIIDFWATWCSPCIHSFPEMDSLQKEFSADLKIITITSDSEDRIVKFLGNFKTNLPIVIDNNDNLAKKFPHRSIPHTILIDKKGIIRAITTSSNINREVIQKLINAEEIDIAEKKDDLDFDPRKSTLSATSNVLGQITLTPFLKGVPSMSTSFKNGRMTFINLLPSTIYEVLYDYPNLTRNSWEVDKQKYKWKEENIYCLEIIAPDKSERQAKQMLINYLQSTISLKVRIEKRESTVKILKKTGKNNRISIASKSEKSEFSSSGRGFEMQNSSMSVFVGYLEQQLNVPVVDETKLTQRYNLNINWYNENPNQIYEDLKNFGLELVEGKRKVDMLIFYE